MTNKSISFKSKLSCCHNQRLDISTSALCKHEVGGGGGDLSSRFPSATKSSLPSPFLSGSYILGLYSIAKYCRKFPPYSSHPLGIPLPTPTPSLPEKYPPPSLLRFRPLTSQAFWNIPAVMITRLIISVSAFSHWIPISWFSLTEYI